MSTLLMDEEHGVSHDGRGRGGGSMLCMLLTRQSLLSYTLGSLLVLSREVPVSTTQG